MINQFKILNCDKTKLKSLNDFELENLQNKLQNNLSIINKTINNKLKSNKLCIICLENPKTILFYPCNHLVCCKMCGKDGRIKKCPVCNKKIDKKMTVFS